METDELKNIWGSQINKNIENYSPEELNRIVIQAAKKSMKLIQPNLIFRIVIGLAVAFLIWSIASNYSMGMNILYSAALALIIVAYLVMEWEARKLNKVNPDIPVKVWLKFRIERIESAHKFQIKHDFLIYGVALLLGHGFYVGSQVVMNVPLNWVSTSVFILFFIISMAITRHFQIKKYNKTLDELKELYKQLDEE
jgi:hypothetical protein